MGIVNVTPDSFSDGGRYLAADAAIEHGRRLRQEGADWIDVGGESTRPGARPVAADEELDRVVPVIESLAADGPVSVDTTKPEVARAAVAAGARMVNDVTALAGDPDSLPDLPGGRAAAEVIRRHDAGMSNWQAWHNAAVAAAGRAIASARRAGRRALSSKEVERLLDLAQKGVGSR